MAPVEFPAPILAGKQSVFVTEILLIFNDKKHFKDKIDNWIIKHDIDMILSVKTVHTNDNCNMLCFG